MRRQERGRHQRLLWGAIRSALLLYLFEAQFVAGQEARLQAIDLLADGFDKTSAEAELLKRTGHTVELLTPPALMTDSLRWALPDPSRSACPDNCSRLIDYIDALDVVATPATFAGIFPSLLNQAEKQLGMKNAQGALESLENALAIVPCVDAVVLKNQLRRLFLFKAMAHMALKDGREQQAFDNLLGVDDAFRLEGDYPVSVRDRLAEASRTRLDTPCFPIDTSGLLDEAFLDGRSVGELRFLLPGTHVFQVRSPFGELRSTVVNIARVPEAASSQATTVRLVTLADFGLPDADQILDMLKHNLKYNKLNSLQIIGLDRYLSRAGLQDVLFSISPPEGEENGLRYYKLDQELLPLPPEWLEPPHTPRKGIEAGIGIGFNMLLGPKEGAASSRMTAGYTLQLDIPLGTPVLGLRLSLVPHMLGAKTEWGGCGLLADGDPPSPVGDSSCTPAGPDIAAAIGLGSRIPLGEKALFVPAFYIDVARFYGPVGSAEASPPVEGSTDKVLLVGPAGRFRLSSSFLERPDLALRIGLELSAGILAAQVDGESVTVVPLGAITGLDAQF